MPTLRAEAASALHALHAGARWRPLAGDASTRRFFRVFLRAGGTRVLMDYGRPFEGDTDDVRLAAIFREAELPVAAIEAVVPDPGFLVLSDLGDRMLEGALKGARDPSAVEGLYAKAVDLAVAIAVRGTRALRRSARAAGPALDAARFRYEMDFFVEHYARGLHGRPGLPRDLAPTLHDLAERAASTPRVLCHRDFHSRNLMVLRDGSLAMVDIQDARWGPDTYDLASLLRDAYADIDEELVVALVERYRASLPDPPEPAPFRRRFDIIAAQRMIKALGTFGYQAHVLGRRRYLDAIPRTIERLERLLPDTDGGPAVLKLLHDSGLLSLPPEVPRG